MFYADYVIQTQISAGDSCEIFRVGAGEEPGDYLLKALISLRASAEEVERLEQEYGLLQRLQRAPEGCLGPMTADGRLGFIADLQEGISLADLPADFVWTAGALAELMARLLERIAELQALSTGEMVWVHGSISPDHVLVSSTGELTLVGFGHARQLSSLDQIGGGMLCLATSPRSVDVFDAALMMGQLIAQVRKFEDDAALRRLGRVVEGIMQAAPATREQLDDVTEACWAFVESGDDLAAVTGQLQRHRLHPCDRLQGQRVVPLGDAKRVETAEPKTVVRPTVAQSGPTIKRQPTVKRQPAVKREPTVVKGGAAAVRRPTVVKGGRARDAAAVARQAVVVSSRRAARPAPMVVRGGKRGSAPVPVDAATEVLATRPSLGDAPTEILASTKSADQPTMILTEAQLVGRLMHRPGPAAPEARTTPCRRPVVLAIVVAAVLCAGLTLARATPPAMPVAVVQAAPTPEPTPEPTPQQPILVDDAELAFAWVVPVSASPVRGFGPWTDKVDGACQVTHRTTLEFTLAPGTTVQAAGPGVVERIDSDADRWTVLVDHGDGLRSRYDGLASVAVAPEATVMPGETLGTSTSRLSYGLSRHGAAVDPTQRHGSWAMVQSPVCSPTVTRSRQVRVRPTPTPTPTPPPVPVATPDPTPAPTPTPVATQRCRDSQPASLGHGVPFEFVATRDFCLEINNHPVGSGSRMLQLPAGSRYDIVFVHRVTAERVGPKSLMVRDSTTKRVVALEGRRIAQRRGRSVR